MKKVILEQGTRIRKDESKLKFIIGGPSARLIRG